MSHALRSLKLTVLILAAVVAGPAAQTPLQPPAVSKIKAAFQQVDRIPKRALTDADWRAAKKQSAAEALASLEPASGAAAGQDVFYLAMLESVAERWKPAAGHLQQYLALPPGTEHDATINRITAQSALRDAFIKGGMADEGEKYYASDRIALALFVSQRGDNARTLKIYEDYLASGPPPDRARTTKSLIVITLGTMRQPDEMGRRLEAFRSDLTPNAIVNNYATLSRLYTEAGVGAKAETYLRLLFEYCKEAKKDDKGVDGPVNAHINWLIARLEKANDPSRLNDFIHRLRTEFAAKPAILANLESRDVFRAVLNQPAREVEAAYVINGERTDLASLRGRVVLLDFFAHWCGPCIADFPVVRDLQKRFETRGLTVLGLSGVYGYYQGERPLAAAAEVQRMKDHFAKEYQVTWPMLFATTKANEKSYGVSYIPHLVLIDRAGVVRFAKVGRADPRELEQEVVRLLAERPPASRN